MLKARWLDWEWMGLRGALTSPLVFFPRAEGTVDSVLFREVDFATPVGEDRRAGFSPTEAAGTPPLQRDANPGRAAGEKRIYALIT